MNLSKDKTALEASGTESPQAYCATDIEKTVAQVFNVLKNIRISIIIEEYQLQDMIAGLLEKNNIPFKKEYNLAPRNRIDFLVSGGLGIEVKKSKPNRTQVTRQLERYVSFDEIKAVILVVERSVNIPNRINGKKCLLFGLNRLWGVAL